MSDAHNIKCKIDLLFDIDAARSLWLALQESAECSYFLSWGWIGTWLSQLPDGLQPLLFTARREKSVVGLAVLLSRPLCRHGFIRSRAIFVNTTGDDELDEITIEYNGFLARPEDREGVMCAALDFLIASGWDEVFIDAVARPPDLPLLGIGWNAQVRKVWPAFGVNLEQLRSANTDYLQSLSRNTRYQVRQAMRAYEEFGEIRVEIATTRQEAELFFAELRRLHQKYWMRKGISGSFANPALNRFHEALVAERFDCGEIQLIRVGFGSHWIGYLYGFRWREAVLNYQSGFDYDLLPKNDRPGIITHVAAIKLNASSAEQYYDFLGGESQHKRVLSNTSVQLTFVVARGTRLIFRLEDTLRRLKKAFLTICRHLIRRRPTQS